MFRTPYLLGWCFVLFSACSGAQTCVCSNHNDNANTGANLNETTLNTSNVKAQGFGKLFSYPVDGSIYAQPLYTPNVSIAGKGVHNVVYVATMNDSVYAFDADSNAGANASPLWSVNFTDPANGITPVPAGDVQNELDIQGPIGILSTPVIDPVSNAIYLLARTKENGAYVQRLHALDIRSGAETRGGPVTIQATLNGLVFDPKIHNQRPALKLANGRVYIAWASHNDLGAYHGWLMAYDATTLQQAAVFVITPSGAKGGIWQSGAGVSVDAAGSVYTVAGNGFWDGRQNFGQSVLRLNASLSVQDWFTPYNWSALNSIDLDLGSTSLLLIPGTTLGLTAGKSGVFYLLETSNLGNIAVGNGQIVEYYPAFPSSVHGSPVYWNSPNHGPLVYFWADSDFLKAFHYNGTDLDLTPIARSAVQSGGMPGAMLSLSANGSTAGSGILWASMPLSGDPSHDVAPGILRAFDASDVSRELWNSEQNSARDSAGNFPKFVPPTVANGKVYLATFSNEFNVYGLLPAGPDFAVNATISTQTVLAGGKAVYTIAISSMNGFSGDVTFSASGLPAGATANFQPATASGSGSTTLTITTSAGGATGTFQIKATGTSGPLSHSVNVTLNVTGPPDFAIAAVPAVRTILPGKSTKYAVTVSAMNGFGGVVTLSASGLPAGASAELAPATVTGSGTATLTVTTTNTVSQGAYSISVAGTSSALSHSTSVTLKVAIPAHLMTKVGVFRSGTWFLDNGNLHWDGTATDSMDTFGTSQDIPVLGDWDGSGKMRIGVFRAGWWYLDLNGNGAWDGPGVDLYGHFGNPGDVPVTGDWDGSGKTKVGVFRSGYWYLDNGNLTFDQGVDRVAHFGQAGDIPVVGDWDGTGTTKIGIFRNGIWALDNGNFAWDPGIDRMGAFGTTGDVPRVGDWNGDGKTKVGVYRNGKWFLDNGNVAWDPGVDRTGAFGSTGDIPVVGDWNGNGQAKVGVFREGMWFLDNGNLAWDPAVDQSGPFGTTTDIPVAGNW